GLFWPPANIKKAAPPQTAWKAYRIEIEELSWPVFKSIRWTPRILLILPVTQSDPAAMVAFEKSKLQVFTAGICIDDDAPGMASILASLSLVRIHAASSPTARASTSFGFGPSTLRTSRPASQRLSLS